ncbi:hypothetical protein BDW74DRAFT_182856 [Aspergillus multicolor]|uniref:uncharacterized protein n=1 Tax=Aspergillus multicolor TaxID=41759 RepID=UPI003CCCB8AF
MAKRPYAELDVFRELIHSIKFDPPTQRNVSYTGLVTTLLAHYFPHTEGFVVTPSEVDPQDDSLTLRVHYYLPKPGQDERPVRIPNYLLVTVIRPSPNVDLDCAHLDPKFVGLDTFAREVWNDLDDSYAMAVAGLYAYIFQYRPQEPEGERFVRLGDKYTIGGQWYIRNMFHLQVDSGRIHGFLTEMSLKTCGDMGFEIIAQDQMSISVHGEEWVGVEA